ncbi:hypothetical protein BSKO_04238 [Bryopsis sp. KO-2023]|nr:hypothetical protein BSKO_04238 [Bryopsis sp. KO-2023]
MWARKFKRVGNQYICMQRGQHFSLSYFVIIFEVIFDVFEKSSRSPARAMPFYSCPTVRTLPWVYSKNCSRRPWNLRQAGIHGNRAYRSSVRACAGDDDDIFDVLVVGGGAAGLTAAYFASENVETAQPPRVAVLERTRESGKKILMSGGSRCNVLPAHVSIETDYFTESSRSALRAVFSSWDLKGCFGWLKDGVGLDLSFEEETQKYFPTSNSSREVRDKLVDACTRNGVTFRYNSFLTKMTDCGASGWRCDLADGDVKFGKRIIFATGGKSFPLVRTNVT